MNDRVMEGCVETPTTSLGFVKLAREQVPARGLSRGHAQMLKEIASRVDRKGCCYAGVRALAAGVVLSERHAGRLLRDLERMRLLETTRRGRGRAARRRLCLDAPMPAPPCPCGTQPLFDAALQPSPDGACPDAPSRSDRPSASSDQPSDVRQKEQEKESVCEDARAPAPPPVLSPSLDAVLTILAAAADRAHVEPAAVDTALRAFPDGDHLVAAHYVATQLLEPDCICRAASVLLFTALRRERQAPPPASRPVSSPHEGRRRQVPAEQKLSPAGRRWGPTGGKFDRAAGLV